MTLRDLLTEGVVTVAELPAMNAIDIAQLDSFTGYTVPLINHDYGAKTPVMWNTAYESADINARNIMVVGDPANTAKILEGLRADPKYMGGGAGSGFKESVIPHLDEVRPNDLKSVNIVVREGSKLVGYNTDAEGCAHGLEEVYERLNKKIEGSHVLIFGAGGVSKELARTLARRRARMITLVNRTYSKAVDLANELNKEYGQIAFGVPEHMIRGTVLSSLDKPTAIVNTTDKGSDGKFVEFSAFAPVYKEDGVSETIARSTLRILKEINPDVIFNDIALTKKGDTVSIRLARSEGLTNLIDGKPMVINQAVPAFDYVQKAHPQVHTTQIELDELLTTFRTAAA